MFKFKSKLPSMVIACAVVMMILISSAIPAFAAGTASVGSVAGDIDGETIIGQDVDQGKQTEYSDEIIVDDEAIESTADVYVTVPSSGVTVTVPKVIILDGKSGAANTGAYTVKVQGDISADTVINVEPQDEMADRDGVNFEMSSAGKKNIPADVAQEKTAFVYADGVRVDAAASTTGTVSAYGMTAGKWNGNFTFNISASDSVMIYSASTGYTSGSYYSSAGELKNASYLSMTQPIAVEEGEKYYFSMPTNKPLTHIIVVCDSEGNYITSYNSNQINELPNSSALEGYEYEYGYITIPEGVEYIIFNSILTEDLEENKFFVYRNSFPNIHSYSSQITGANNLTNKSVIAFGDSITLGNNTKYESYMTYIAEGNNISLTNNAVSGAKSDSILTTGLNEANVNDYDYVIVGGFVNDVANKTELGSITADGTTEFDTTTFVGRLEDSIYKYQQSGKTAKLGFVLTGEIDDAVLQNTYWSAAIEVFEKYDVDYLDLRELEYEIMDWAHPTSDGHLTIAEYVEAWMNTL